MLKQLCTVDEVIKELGGYPAMRELIPRKSTSAALMWNFRNKFPANTFLVLTAALEAKGASAPASLWGMPQTEDASS
jgi:hypothetical protein